MLNKAERAQIELTLRIVKRVRSLLLTRVLTSIVIKLLTALESKVKRLTREVGQHLAKRISSIAKSWGHVSAFLWRAEHSFVRYLTVMHLNTLEIYKSREIDSGVQGET